MVDYSQLEALEITAGKYDLAYIKLDGTIGCLVNGAGLAMATLDVLNECGGKQPISSTSAAAPAARRSPRRSRSSSRIPT